MAPAQRIIVWQASIVLGAALLIPGVVMLAGQGFDPSVSNSSALLDGSDGSSGSARLVKWALVFASMLMGGLSVVLPSWGYLALTKGEHRSERLLLFAWVKIVGTIVLLAIGMILAPRPAWLLGGLAIAYVGHAVAAYQDG